MAMVIDTIAKYGVLRAIKSLLLPQNTNSAHTEISTPRYACVRKKYESGRKGRICVYRIGDERTNSDGRKVRLYTNVEGVRLDKEERQSFTGFEHTRNHNRSRSMRHKKGRTPPAPDKVIKSKAKLKKLAVKPCDPGDEGSDRRSKSHDTAPSQAKGFSFSSNEESVVPQPLNSRKRPRHKLRSDPHRTVSVAENHWFSQQANIRQNANRPGDRPSRVERLVQKELGHYCSGALSTPHHQPDRLRLGSARGEPSRKPRATAIDSTIKLVDDAGEDALGVVEHDQGYGEQIPSVTLEATGSPFLQLGLTPQESSDLVFGLGSKVETWRKLQAGRMDDRIAPDVHEFASQLIRDDVLGEAEQTTEAFSPYRKPYAMGLECSPRRRQS